MKRLFVFFIFFNACLLMLSSCRKWPVDTSPSVKLSFSTDTIYFDTVFTSVGSSSIYFKLYNNESKTINISSISIAGATSSFFYLNVNGVKGSAFTNVTLNPKDSIYVYVAVTINPNVTTNPFVVFDSILFNTNGNQQRIVLEAYGQNAYFHKGTIISANTTWPNDKPHIILDSLHINPGVTLTLQPSTRVYVHAYTYINVYGTLNAVSNSVKDSIVFQGDRLEQYYVGLPGNWGGIVFEQFSKDNMLEHVIVTDAVDGVYVDSLSVDNQPKLTMKKCQIRNMYDAGIVSYIGSIAAQNCLVYNCGNYCAELYYGGNNTFQFCTFADYGSIIINHQMPSVVVANYKTIDNINYAQTLTATKALFTNCIIYGSLANELVVVSDPDALPITYSFSYCNIESNAPPSLDTCQLNTDPLFNNYPNGDLTVSSSSPCIGAAKLIGIGTDYNDANRSPIAPTIGCFEK